MRIRKQKLTPRQAEYLDYIKGFIKENIYSPSLQEIATHFDSKVGTAQKFVDVLISKGYLTKEDGRHRSINVMK